MRWYHREGLPGAMWAMVILSLLIGGFGALLFWRVVTPLTVLGVCMISFGVARLVWLFWPRSSNP